MGRWKPIPCFWLIYSSVRLFCPVVRRIPAAAFKNNSGGREDAPDMPMTIWARFYMDIILKRNKSIESRSTIVAKIAIHWHMFFPSASRDISFPGRDQDKPFLLENHKIWISVPSDLCVEEIRLALTLASGGGNLRTGSQLPAR